MIYIFDLDGTLADITHRLPLIHGDSPDWRAFFAASSNDTPILEVVEVARSLHAAGHTLVILTGRSDECADATSDWLMRHDIPFATLFMRKAGDHRPDTIVKAELLDQYRETWGWHDEAMGEEIGGVFEDRASVVKMYRERGLRVFQVAEGDF